MTGLRYLDSTGAKAFLDAHRMFTRTGRRIALAAVQPLTMRILEVMGLEKVLPIFPTVDAAVENLRKGGKPKPDP
jgi:anti-anti-sigma factor